MQALLSDALGMNGFTEKFVVNNSNCLICIFLADQNRNLDFTGRNHGNIDIRFIQGLEHIRCNARMCFHACTDN